MPDFGRGRSGCGSRDGATALLCQWWRRVGIDGGGRVEGLGGGVKGESNGRQRDDHR